VGGPTSCTGLVNHDIFAGINVRGRPGFFLKMKEVFKDRFVRFGGISFVDKGFRPAL
jgi:hypothetical protein